MSVYVSNSLTSTLADVYLCETWLAALFLLEQTTAYVGLAVTATHGTVHSRTKLFAGSCWNVPNRKSVTDKRRGDIE